MKAIRGATTVESNTVENIKKESIKLFKEIITKNNINLDDIISLEVSCTRDITKDYPGKFIREEFKLDKLAIMHFNEMQVEGSLPFCIRFLLLIEKSNKDKVSFVYLNKAKTLRKDLMNK